MAQISKRKNNFEMKLLIMRKRLGVFLVFCLVTLSCSTDEPVIPDMGLDYYPLQVGNYAIYEVEETIILQSVETQTSFDLRITVTDSSKNEQGVVYYLLVREKRTSPSGNWEALDTWSTKVIDNKTVQNEGNVLFVKLVFPPSLNLKWDGNLFNNLPDDGNIFNDSNSDHYFISDLDEPITLPSGFETNQSLTVIQNDFSDNIVGIDQRKEVYAKGVGLIYKEITQLEYCTSSNCLGQQKVDKGVILVQSLKEHGQI